MACNLRRTLPVVTQAVEPGYRRAIGELPLGASISPFTARGAIEGISPQHVPWRTSEYVLFASAVVDDGAPLAESFR